MRLAILMPAYDEGERLHATLSDIAQSAEARGASDEITVFVVDDGAKDAVVADDLARVAKGIRVVLARHAVNLGQGAALETARRLALDSKWSDASEGPFTAFVTMDSDGQHRAEDALALAEAVEAGADVALGNRFAGNSNVPRGRRLLLALARVFERLTTGLVLADAHNGLRALSPAAIAAIKMTQNRMAHATELTRRIAYAKLAVVEIPVSVRYTTASLAKGQRAGGAIAILADLFRGFLFGNPR